MYPPLPAKPAKAQKKENVELPASPPQEDLGEGPPRGCTQNLSALPSTNGSEPEKQSFAAMIRSQQEPGTDAMKPSKPEKQIVVAKAKPNPKDLEDILSRAWKIQPPKALPSAAAPSPKPNHIPAAPKPQPPVSKPGPTKPSQPPVHPEAKASPNPPAHNNTPTNAPRAKEASGSANLSEAGAAKPKAPPSHTDGTAKSRLEPGGKPKPEALPPPKDHPKKAPAKAEAKPEKRDDRPETLKIVAPNAAPPKPAGDPKQPKKKAKGPDGDIEPPSSSDGPKETIHLPQSPATPGTPGMPQAEGAPHKKKKKGKGGEGVGVLAGTSQPREASGVEHNPAWKQVQAEKEPGKVLKPLKDDGTQPLASGEPEAARKGSTETLSTEAAAVTPTMPEGKKKPKKKLKPKNNEGELLYSLEEASGQGPPASEELTESKQERRQRIKETQEKEDHEKLSMTGKPLQEMEVRHKQQQMQQCFQRVSDTQGSMEYKLQLANLATALRRAQQLQSIENMKKCKKMIAGVYMEMKDHYNALKYYEMASKLMDEARDLPELSHCFRQMAIVSGELGNHEKEMEFHAKSVQVMEDVPVSLEELRDTPHRGIANSFLSPDTDLSPRQGAEKLLNLGHLCYTALQSYRAGVVCLKTAQSMFVQDKSTEHLQALPMQLLGELYLALSDYRKARDLLGRCIKVCKDHIDEPRLQHALVLASCGLGRCLLKEGRYREAEEMLEENIEKAEAYDLRHPTGSSSVEANSNRETLKDSYGLLQCALVEQKRDEQAWLRVENGPGSLAVEKLRRDLRLEDRGYGIRQVTYAAIRDLATRLNVTLVHYAELESDIACWVVQPCVDKITFQRLKKPFKRQAKDQSPEDVMAHTHDSLLAGQQELIVPIRDLLPSEPQSLIGFVVSEKCPLREIPFASLAAHGGVPLCRDHQLFTVHSVAILAFLVDVLLAARSSPAELPIGLSDFLTHIAVPHPDDPSKTMSQQHKHLLNEWGVDILLASLPRSSCLDDVDA
eukprot:GGOE01005390.1.p1 GENE.GGOE01005390.1~~GGOE01005390.1.p1  ORF type:complete len:1007 (-),score=261.45 GGOE01005390.1:194-3214(-)